MWIKLGLAATAVVLSVGEARAAECMTAPGARVGSAWWSWREIDGRRCWYLGRPGKSKRELAWVRHPFPRWAGAGEADKSSTPATPATVPESATVDIVVEEPETPTRLTEDDLLGRTCCWPDLNAFEKPQPLKVERPEFWWWFFSIPPQR